jgi:hypothetical protein
MSIAKRGRLYHLHRRVPRRYGRVEPRKVVWISLHTDFETIARSKADRAWSQMIEEWEARLAGNGLDPEPNRPGFAGGQNSRRIARYGTDIKEEDLEVLFTRVPRTCGAAGYGTAR